MYLLQCISTKPIVSKSQTMDYVLYMCVFFFFQSLPKLSILDVSWNQLHHLYTNVSILKKHVNTIQSLDISRNPWQEEVNTQEG